jgi:hypothetical protein
MKKLLSLFLGFTILIAPFSAQAAEGSKTWRYVLHSVEIALGALISIPSIKLTRFMTQEANKQYALASTDWQEFLKYIKKTQSQKRATDMSETGQRDSLFFLNTAKKIVYVAGGSLSTLGIALIAHGSYKIHKLRTGN